MRRHGALLKDCAAVRGKTNREQGLEHFRAAELERAGRLRNCDSVEIHNAKDEGGGGGRIFLEVDPAAERAIVIA